MHFTRTQVGSAGGKTQHATEQDVTRAPGQVPVYFRVRQSRRCRVKPQALARFAANSATLARITTSRRAGSPMAFAAGDRIQFTKRDEEARPRQRRRRHRARHIENGRVFVEWTTAARTVSFRQRRHQVSATATPARSTKGQGDTVNKTYLYHSEHWRASASYISSDPAQRESGTVRRHQHREGFRPARASIF